MKPSERIKELRKQINEDNGNFSSPQAYIVEAIIKHLDEEYEKKQFKNQNMIPAGLEHHCCICYEFLCGHTTEYTCTKHARLP
jgi:hypothetical protein